ncbi:MAG: hypothetical protein ACI90A_000096, partial [Shewanella sp.]
KADVSWVVIVKAVHDISYLIDKPCSVQSISHLVNWGITSKVTQ